jgi:hypothetical protein
MVLGLLGIKLISKMNKFNKIKMKVLVQIQKMNKKVNNKVIQKVDMRMKMNPIVRVEVKNKT